MPADRASSRADSLGSIGTRVRSLAEPTSGLRLAAARIGLPAWFALIDLLWIANPAALAIDARHYQRATNAWLAGVNPWAVSEHGITYAAGPHTLLFYVPTSLLPLGVSTLVWMALGFAASVWLVRRLGLQLWWVAFPPLAHSIWNGNPQTIALALLVYGGPITAALAVGLKLYAGVPLLGRWRDLVIAGILLAIALPLLPWRLYLQQGLGVSNLFQYAWNGSAWRLPILIPPTLLGLWVLRRRGAEWFAVPAVWPATEFYYVAMALPAVAGYPILAAALALPMPLMTPIVVIAYAAWVHWPALATRVRQLAPA
ncbi:MAG: hypothetical protein ACLQBX_02480 [Candidatus Limnocylindrales bacterium]